MKFYVQKSDLLTVMQKVIKIVPARPTLQVLSNICISVKGSVLAMRAADLDLSMSARTEVKSSGQDRDFIINAKKLFDICKELPEKEILFNAEKSGFVQISTGVDEFKLPIQTADEYPEIPSFEERASFSLNAKLLDDMASRVRFAVSRDTTRVALKGVLMELEQGSLKMVATDGHKLGFCKETGLPVTTKKKISIIVPPKALDQLPNIMDPAGGDVSVKLGETYIEFTVNTTVLTSKLIEGEYPNYEQVIPQTNTKKAVIKRDELFSSLRRISVISNSRTRQIRFAFEKNSLTVSTSDRDFNGEGKSSLPIIYDTDPIAIGFNVDFFIEILRLIDDEDIVINMNTPLSAVLVLPADKKKSEKMLFLIMPLRLLDEGNE
ncbi:MAG: DNA polymerase III subunit beta [Candidatus Raymondbacteria bacterium RifOxyA12_full_50_37]|uniref:Beta sliding clamp n=1 Tax=Candidatus Raymondbacteria bacterium RIFOXYD12_FULL_49_13 TaxID=1817890 RepID=A0A1F7F029_UNCRA|nr:MAG: DNA polymerase III subunit beta [Candidatus Raymondbacteria bacterium RifOxyA12_full_50_37]OGJ93049.1 MAG: DNA polymerase III subunit beta [Candidatus Raymondbacteria bacterium RIFOXYA2_FULL_49_16]OGJ94881.1 MAG: DNA polymerase III subunit beta [Candidatus Raymondbacteria bacterium RifOxyB12_full_50_8]OGJ99961.1 MAG: DNA polymerase III subunit beta [Candidatus Raymondbacteria bacterium RIFOXYD12_FULL_49_13]OGK04153.1 MAG: DNA polymerase III subunit beta [Candidatus Raymondbacteria bacte